MQSRPHSIDTISANHAWHLQERRDLNKDLKQPIKSKPMLQSRFANARDGSFAGLNERVPVSINDHACQTARRIGTRVDVGAVGENLRRIDRCVTVNDVFAEITGE